MRVSQSTENKVGRAQALHESALRTALLCAEEAMAFLQGFDAKPENLARKGDNTWVTDADVALEKRFRAIIAKEHPLHSIEGEEEGVTSGAAEHRWILDPIDGTFSFVHGVPFYSSLIAFLDDGVPSVGVACLPALGITIAARLGGGVQINGVPYQRSHRVGAEAIELVATADPYRFRMTGQGPRIQRLLGSAFRTRTYPDALGYYLLLKGAVRAFVDPKVEVWDVAPFHVILPEAGFAIHSWDGERGLRRGTSVAYPLDPQGEPLRCEDVLSLLKA